MRRNLLIFILAVITALSLFRRPARVEAQSGDPWFKSYRVPGPYNTDWYVLEDHAHNLVCVRHGSTDGISCVPVIFQRATPEAR